MTSMVGRVAAHEPPHSSHISTYTELRNQSTHPRERGVKQHANECGTVTRPQSAKSTVQPAIMDSNFSSLRDLRAPRRRTEPTETPCREPRGYVAASAHASPHSPTCVPTILCRLRRPGNRSGIPEGPNRSRSSRTCRTDAGQARRSSAEHLRESKGNMQ